MNLKQVNAELSVVNYICNFFFSSFFGIEEIKVVKIVV